MDLKTKYKLYKDIEISREMSNFLYENDLILFEKKNIIIILLLKILVQV